MPNEKLGGSETLTQRRDGGTHDWRARARK
jgi:hypothetical protein